MKIEIQHASIFEVESSRRDFRAPARLVRVSGVTQNGTRVEVVADHENVTATRPGVYEIELGEPIQPPKFKDSSRFIP